MLMMMRVNVTSVLLILGIFCSASWAQPEAYRWATQPSHYWRTRPTTGARSNAPYRWTTRPPYYWSTRPTGARSDAPYRWTTRPPYYWSTRPTGARSDAPYRWTTRPPYYWSTRPTGSWSEAPYRWTTRPPYYRPSTVSSEVIAAMRCMQPRYHQCIRPLMNAYYWLTNEEIVNQIVSTDLSVTCGPVLAAQQCVTELMTECGLFELTEPPFVDAIRMQRLQEETVNYVCRDHVEVFDEHKACLLRMSDGRLDVASDVIRQCPMPQFPGPTTSFCVPQELTDCGADIVEQQCGEEIADALRTFGAEVLTQYACDASKGPDFQKLKEKKKIQSPLELINEALSSLF